MIDYSDFSVERFVMDNHFQEWVKYPNAENTLFWTKWVEEHPDKAGEIQQARLLILSMDFKRTPGNEIPQQLMFKKIQASILQINEKSIVVKSSSINIYYKVAAVFLGLLISTAALHFLTSSETYSTGYGEIEYVTLPDGSNLVLNANSSVHFKNNWEAEGIREIWLQGEAFFKVSHKENHQKFVVRTDRLDVEVLGTEFNVKNRRNTTRVILNSGKVKLTVAGLTDDGMSMKPGESGEVSAYDNKLIKKTVNPEQFSSWTKNRLVFKGTPLIEIAQTLEDNYGWQSTFEEEAMKSYQFTGTVSTESNEKIELLLLTISEAFNIEIVKEDQKIIFKKKK